MNDLAGGALALAQDHVLVVRNALDDADLAHAALALLAVVEHVDASLDEHVENALVRRHEERLAGTLEHHFEGAFGQLRLRGGLRPLDAEEQLELHARRGPSELAPGIDRRLDHGPWPTHVDGCVGGQRREEGSKIEEAASGLVEVQVQRLPAQGLDLLAEGHILVGSRRIGELERQAFCLQLRRHRYHRRDADAAADQCRTPGAGHTGEIVRWRLDLDIVADLQAVHVARAAFALLLEPHADLVVRGRLCRPLRVHEGVLAHADPWNGQCDVRAGLEPGQGAAVGPLQPDAADHVGLGLHLADDKGEMAHVGAPSRGRSDCGASSVAMVLKAPSSASPASSRRADCRRRRTHAAASARPATTAAPFSTRSYFDWPRDIVSE